VPLAVISRSSQARVTLPAEVAYSSPLETAMAWRPVQTLASLRVAPVDQAAETFHLRVATLHLVPLVQSTSPAAQAQMVTAATLTSVLVMPMALVVEEQLAFQRDLRLAS